MIVLGVDTHKGSHSIAAVAAGTGELLGDQTAAVGAKGFLALLDWARNLGSGRWRTAGTCQALLSGFRW